MTSMKIIVRFSRWEKRKIIDGTAGQDWMNGMSIKNKNEKEMLHGLCTNNKPFWYRQSR
jgi:hypothetical protein